MKCNFIVNGSIKLAISAENELEKALMEQLFKGEVSNQYFEKMPIADKVLPDTVLITVTQPPVQA